MAPGSPGNREREGVRSRKEGSGWEGAAFAFREKRKLFEKAGEQRPRGGVPEGATFALGKKRKRCEKRKKPEKSGRKGGGFFSPGLFARGRRDPKGLGTFAARGSSPL